MILDLLSIKLYIVSPMEGKYKDRFETVYQRLKDAGFTNIVSFKSISDEKPYVSLTKTIIEIFSNEINNNEPFIILEDDCGLENIEPIIEIPESTDLLYLGVALWIYPHDFSTLGLNHGHQIHENKTSDIIDYNETLTKINGMTSTHAILYNNRNFMKEFIEKAKTKLDINLSHDLIVATMHRNYSVFALKNPIFYQDSSIGGHESVTRLKYKDGRYY
jgi:hypothetical protein